MAGKAKKYKWESWDDFLKLRDYVVVDVVATGQSVDKEKIIEIAMVKVVDGAVAGEYHSLVNPEKKVPTRVENVTGILSADVESAPRFGDIAAEVNAFLGDSVVVASNAASVAGFLSHELGAHVKAASVTYFDLEGLVKKAFPGLENGKLDSAVDYLEIGSLNGHRASEWAAYGLQVFQHIYENYDTALARAIGRCCSPMTDYLVESPGEVPLKGKSVVIYGDLTFSTAAARGLIQAAGGVLETKLNKDIDYLLCGYVDSHKHPAWMEPAIHKVRKAHLNGAKTEPINEVALLKLCGMSLSMGEERGVQDKMQSLVDDVLQSAVRRSEAVQCSAGQKRAEGQGKESTNK